MEATKDQRKAVVTFLAVVIVAIVVVSAVIASPKKKPGSASAATNSGPPAATPAATASSGATSFKDGTYVATGSYESPGGNEDITVHVTLQNGVIAATSADSGAQDPESREYENMFINGYKSLVVGKDIASVSLGRVSGSSLTAQGFNDAINQIKNQAKV